MTFPFSHHNYQLRYWMAAGGIDPDEDVRLVVLPPPYMVESLASKQVDAFCVGAPWNSVAVDLGVGSILHFGREIMTRVSEKVFALRQQWAEENPDIVARLVRALVLASNFVSNSDNRATFAHIVAQRLDINSELVIRTLTGNLKTTGDGTIRKSERYIVVSGHEANRPDVSQATWAYAQMVRWGQAQLSAEFQASAENVFAPIFMIPRSI
jgi:NitT/TauT family transport system ATP-binding protein